MTMLTPEKAIRSLKKTPVLLNAILLDVDQERAVTSMDGPDGWNIVFIVCHMRDFEKIYYDRIHMLLDTDYPSYLHFDQNELCYTNQYADQTLPEVVADFLEQRRKTLLVYENLTPEQWERGGVHPEFGDHSLLEFAINAALHDVNHLEQIARTLGLAPALF